VKVEIKRSDISARSQELRATSLEKMEDGRSKMEIKTVGSQPSGILLRGLRRDKKDRRVKEVAGDA
jgi:hypothetical protein